MRSADFTQFDGELYFAEKLREVSIAILAGATDHDILRERIREAIIGCDLVDVVVGRRGGKQETYGQAFERFYGEPLRNTTPTRGMK